MLGSADAGSARRAQHHRAAEPPLRAVAQPRGVVHQLIDAGIEKPHELDLAHRSEALSRHADAQAADQQFRQRGVHHTLGSKALLQAGSCAKDAAIDADILAEHDDARVLLHSAGEGQGDGFDQGYLRHGMSPSARRAARCRCSAARHRGDRIWSQAHAGAWPDSVQQLPQRAADTPLRVVPPLPCPMPSG